MDIVKIEPVGAMVKETTWGKYYVGKESGVDVVTYIANNGNNKRRWKVVNGKAEVTEKVGPGTRSLPKVVMNMLPDTAFAASKG